MTKAINNSMLRMTETYDTLLDGEVVGTGGTNVFPISDLDTAVWQIILQAHPDNVNRVFVGNHLTQHFILVPGAAYTIPIDRLNGNFKAHVRITGTDIVNWHAVG